MRVCSSSGERQIDVVKDEKNYILQNKDGVVIARREEKDEDGICSLMNYIKNLLDNYDWSEKYVEQN